MILEQIEQSIQERIKKGNLRVLSPSNGLIDFASNDYLGLGKSCSSGGTGPSGSRLLTGNSEDAEALEAELAYLHGYESALLFGCGYLANIGVLSALGRLNGSVILYDARIHASSHDGMRLARAKCYPFRHNDMGHLEWRLQKIGKGAIICIESVYSVDGSIAPLPAIALLAEKYGAYLIIDEAHAIGVIGPYGLVAQQHLQKKVFAQVITFGKGVGAYGAAILGSKKLKTFLLNFARSCIYTSALPPHAIAAIKAAYEKLPKLHQERAHLHHLCQLLGFSKTPIQPFYIPGNERVSMASKALSLAGFDVRALKSPTTAAGDELLRIVLHTFNSVEEVMRLKKELAIWA